MYFDDQMYYKHKNIDGIEDAINSLVILNFICFIKYELFYYLQRIVIFSLK